MPWTGPTIRTTGDLITASIWNTDLVSDLLLLKVLHDDSGNVSYPAPSTLTLSANVAGAVTPTQNVHAVDTNGAAASGDLATLTIAGNVRAGHVLKLTAANIAHVVTVRDGAGNIVLRNGSLALDAANKFLELLLVGTTWYEQNRSSAGLPLFADPVAASGKGW